MLVMFDKNCDLFGGPFFIHASPASGRSKKNHESYTHAIRQTNHHKKIDCIIGKLYLLLITVTIVR